MKENYLPLVGGWDNISEAMPRSEPYSIWVVGFAVAAVVLLRLPLKLHLNVLLNKQALDSLSWVCDLRSDGVLFSRICKLTSRNRNQYWLGNLIPLLFCHFGLDSLQGLSTLFLTHDHYSFSLFLVHVYVAVTWIKPWYQWFHNDLRLLKKT